MCIEDTEQRGSFEFFWLSVSWIRVHLKVQGLFCFFEFGETLLYSYNKYQCLTPSLFQFAFLFGYRQLVSFYFKPNGPNYYIFSIPRHIFNLVITFQEK